LAFAFQDFVVGPVAPLLYPLPFAADASTNFLLPPDELRKLLLEIGFEERAWVNQTPEILAMPPVAPAPPGAVPTAPQLLQGANLQSNMQRMRRNYEEERLVFYRGVFERP